MPSVLLIGLGNMGSKYLKKFLERGIEPAVCDLDLSKAPAGLRFYRDFEKIDFVPDLVVAAVDPRNHPRIARRFLPEGSKVFLEKPPAPSSAEFRPLAERYEGSLFVSEIERYSKALEGFKTKGVTSIEIRRLNPKRGYLDPLWDLGWHDFYLLLDLFKDLGIKRVSKSGFHYRVEGFAGGVPFTYEVAWDAERPERVWRLETSKGEVVLDFLREERFENGKRVSFRSEGDKLGEMIDDLLKEAYDPASARRAVKVLEVLEGAVGKG